MNKPFKPSELPLAQEIESKIILKESAKASGLLGELKGIAKTIPNQNILLNALPLLEAKDSSAIENIITTHDELYKQDLLEGLIANPKAKEVTNYKTALNQGFTFIKENGFLANKHLLKIHQLLINNDAGFRKMPGTTLQHEQTKEIIYTPPQDAQEILKLMRNLETFINDDSFSDLDGLVKLALIHYQFESIHPFYDGNGRIGRIINVLYLVLKGYLDLPILYLSRYIIKNKSSYYRLLQKARDGESFEEWILFLLTGIQETSRETIIIIQRIQSLMTDYKRLIRDSYQFKFYSQDLLNNLFKHPYTKIEFLEFDLRINRQTAAKYLNLLTGKGLLHKHKIGKRNFYVNAPLLTIFTESSL